MRRFLLRAAVGGAALLIGVIVGTIHQRLLHKQSSANFARAVATHVSQPAEGAMFPTP